MAIDDSYDLLGFHPILSADSRFGQTDFADDQTWEICLDDQAPLRVQAETTYGLRAKLAQVFPIFLDANNLPFHDPAPRLTLEKILPDLAIYQIRLFSDMDVRLVLSVPNSQTLCGLFTLKMAGIKERRIRAGVMMRLSPIQNGQIMSVQQIDDRTVLSGRTEDLFPICMVSGLPRPIHRPQPGLVVDATIIPDHPVQVRWAICTKTSKAQSIAGALHAIQGIQIPVIQKKVRESESSGLVIQTGNPDWNDAFHLADIQSRRLITSRNEMLPFPTMLTSRQPDHGNSSRGDGGDYPPELQGPSIWEAYHAIHNHLLPAQPALAAGILSNFVQVQQGYGNVDLRPGLGGYKSHVLAPPILATMLTDIHPTSPSAAIIRECYPILVYLLERWIDSDHDRDGDHLPEWNHILQTGWDDHPLFNRWAGKNRYMPPDVVETPALGAILYRECRSMLSLTEIIDKPADRQRWKDLSEQVKEQVLSLWDKRKKIFQYRDRDTHEIPGGETVFSSTGSGLFQPDRTVSPPQRLVMEIHCKPGHATAFDIQFAGRDTSGQHTIERLTEKPSAGMDERFVLTTTRLFQHLDQVSISGLGDKDRWSLHLLDLNHEDLTCFLPLWAGIPDQKMAGILVQKKLIPEWTASYPSGIPMIIKPGAATRRHPQPVLTHTLFQTMVIDGLLQYGFHSEAGSLVNGMMEAIINNVKAKGSFSDTYDAETGKPFGDANTLFSLPPVGLFLRSLGLTIHKPGSILVGGRNPYPWDVEIQFRGTRIFRGDQDVEINFQDGKTTHLKGPEMRLVSWKTDQGGA